MKVSKVDQKKLVNVDFCNETTKLKQEIENSFLTLGERLKRIRDEELYSGQWTSFEEYLLDSKISPATASKLINIYSRFYLAWNFPNEKLALVGGWTILATLLPVCKTKEEAEEWIHKATTLSRPDLEKEIRESKTGIEMKDCAHTKAYTIKVCPDCSYKERIYETK